MIILGILTDVASLFGNSEFRFFGTFGFTLPAIMSFVFTKPLVEYFGKKITWNRSALLVLACFIFSIIISFFPVLLIFEGIVPLLFAVSLGFIFGIRLIVLVAIADFRLKKMFPAAVTQSFFGTFVGYFYFGPDFLLLSVTTHILFGICVFLFLWLIERPLKKNFNISALNFINAFIAHNTDGSKALETFFREIGEEVYVPQVSLFFKREDKEDVIFTVPNLHPGPMGEIGGGNLPRILHDSLPGEAFVAHGCATHDFNLVSEDEVSKIADAVKKSALDVEYSEYAGKSMRFECGTVKTLVQTFGDSVLAISTRSPGMTEDLDYPIGLAIMAEGHKRFKNVAFVDAHNCMVDVVTSVLPASFTAYEYIRGALSAFEGCYDCGQDEFSIGVCRMELPFTRADGFGDLGIQTLVVETAGQRTAYVLFDGNNIHQGVREKIRAEVLRYVDECELMTSDSHVVNTMSGKNPVGLRVPPEDIIPYVIDSVKTAVKDLSPATAAASTGWCEGVVVFGSQRISQLASTVNAMLTYVAPLGVAILGVALVFSVIAYLILL
ncbi:DUF2070 family protein [Methanoplanus endosymbiosus]|uniref:DUF2070 family protein n=1 Tax=Methanoplanus endosymbiosus TaxID=33865 RepID=UPI0027E341C3|nr:DUF2070 family protein [Methanoplanus endosymbiosus]